MITVSEFTPRSVLLLVAVFISALNSSLFVANAAIAVFMSEISHDLGWGHAQIGGAASMLFLGMAAGAPFFGQLVDRFGPRAVMLPLTACSGVLMASLSFPSHSLILFYAGHFALGLATPSAVTTSKLISMWFSRHRGIALTTLSIGVFCCQMAIPLFAQQLMYAVGWKHSYLVFGGAEVLMCWPILFLFYREPERATANGDSQRSIDLYPDHAPAIGIWQAMSGKTYSIIVGTQAAATFVQMGTATHAIGILTSHGVSAVNAVWGLSAFSAGGLVAQAMTGVLVDRFDTPRVIAPFALLALLGTSMLQLGAANELATAAIILIGVGCGGQTNVTSYFITRYYGVRNFSSIYGSVLPVLLLLAAPAPALVGAIFDRSGSYAWALGMMSVILIIAAILFWSLSSFPYPVKRTSAEPGMAGA